MRKLTFNIIIWILVSVCISYTFAEKTIIPKNIILFIGDGMGVSCVTALIIVKENPNIERFKISGLLRTHCENRFITDSGAAGTALATGQKTYYRAISYSSQKTHVKTAVEYAEEKGKSTGLVVTCSVTHATPASFIAHVEHRNKQTEIAEQIANSSIDVIFGGGLSFFIPESIGNSMRKDNKDLITLMKKRMKIIRSVEEFHKFNQNDNVAGFFADEHLPLANERIIRLDEMTKKAIDILSQNEKGFFLMVEGSHIDWGAHHNDLEEFIPELVEFDNAIGIGFEFAEKNGQTLVVVAADHETGGFAIHDGSIEERKIEEAGFTSESHTGAMVPVFAYGPGSSAFGGIQDNTNVGKTIIDYIIKFK
jgi:alkaline phosphatase